MRKGLWVLAALVLLGGGLYLGAWGGWRLHSVAVRKGCVPLVADVAPVQIRPATPGHVRFAALGDTGTGTPGARRVAESLRRVCTREGCDFVAFVGDNIYPDGVTSLDDPLFASAFESVYAGLEGPVLLTLGNHDVHSAAIYEVLHTRESRLWRMPNFEYDYQVGPARFFAINTNCTPLTQWRLAPKVAQPFAGWTFVIGHMALYSYGPHGDANWSIRWRWAASREHVDFYVAGYNHLLEHLQRPGERTDYVVTGAGGGAPGAPIDSQGPSAAEHRFKRWGSGFAWFDVTAAEVILRFYDDAGAPLYEYRRKRAAS